MASDDDFFTRIPRFLRREGKADPRPAAAPAPSTTPIPANLSENAASPAQDPAVPASVMAPTETKPAPSRRAMPLASNGPVQRTARAPEAGDAPFQVTLPKELIRQIRVRAAEDDTTHRAIILRALKLYGFTIPDGQDIDRRKVTARRG